MRATLFVTAAFFLFAGPALADGPIATAGGSGPEAPEPTAPQPPLPSAGSAPAMQQQPVAMGPCGPEKVKADGQLETAPHGEVEAGIGTGGYRHLAGTVCQPIGQNGAVVMSAGYSQANSTYRRH